MSDITNLNGTFSDRAQEAANQGPSDDFDAWHARLNKIVNPETGEPLRITDSIESQAVLATPEEVKTIQDNHAWLKRWDEIKPRFSSLDND